MVDIDALAQQLDALLPQTQCRQCGFAGCLPYAQAIALGEADINQCPPGGDSTIAALAQWLNRAPRPLNPAHGLHKPRHVAVIDEHTCIGCVLCIKACPVDAILGAAKHIHTVIAAECTGCELCLAPCPVDCISLLPLAGESPAHKKQRAQIARRRYRFRLQRLERENEARRQRRNPRLALSLTPVSSDDLSLARRKETVRTALERARAKRAGAPTKPCKND